jgi:hypothetical protein
MNVKILDFGPIIIIEYEGATLISIKRVGTGWSATDGRTTAQGSKAKTLAWAKARAEEIKVQSDR